MLITRMKLSQSGSPCSALKYLGSGCWGESQTTELLVGKVASLGNYDICQWEGATQFQFYSLSKGGKKKIKEDPDMLLNQGQRWARCSVSN